MDITRLETYNKGIALRVNFPNGYGASIVCHDDSYGGPYSKRDSLFELAVLKDDKINYTTSITDDVLGWLTLEKINKILKEIERL